ncbi:MAG: hypothetical protein IKQ95_01765 [Synergistaceae bacterium]|nr:hypothetical protein [Synergistaceae bacterium]
MLEAELKTCVIPAVLCFAYKPGRSCIIPEGQRAGSGVGAQKFSLRCVLIVSMNCAV